MSSRENLGGVYVAESLWILIGLNFSKAVVLAGVIPRLTVTAFIRDYDCVVGDSDGIVEVGFDFSAGPLGEFYWELSAKGVVDGVDGFDN